MTELRTINTAYMDVGPRPQHGHNLGQADVKCRLASMIKAERGFSNRSSLMNIEPTQVEAF